MTAIKTEHLNIRLDEHSKKKIEQEEIILSDRDGDIFFDAILNPPSPNKALYDAFLQHSQLVKSDV